MILLLVVTDPLSIKMQMKGLLPNIPVVVMPVTLISEMVLFEMADVLPFVMPLNRIALKLPVAPVSAYVPVCALVAYPMVLLLMVNPCAPDVAVDDWMLMALWVAVVVHVRDAV